MCQMTKQKALNKEFAVLIQGKTAWDWGGSSSQEGGTVPRDLGKREFYREKATGNRTGLARRAGGFLMRPAGPVFWGKAV